MEFLNFSKLSEDFLLGRFSVEMADDGGAGSQVSNAASFIKISSLDWKIGETIYSTGIAAVENKMCKTFGEQWETALVEGVIVGKGVTRNVHVLWTNLKVPKKLSMDAITKSSKTHQHNQEKNSKKLSIILR